MPADSTGQGVGVHVTVFGKHAGWPGSIEDIGLTCEPLTRAKRSLYLLGLGSNADSGAWDKVAPDERMASYPSIVLWKLGTSLVVGRLASARVGGGRADAQPMFACALVERMPHAWSVDTALPVLQSVESKAAQTSSPELVRLSVGEARRQLEDKALIDAARHEQSASNLGELIDHADLGPSRAGLLRVLGQLEKSRQASEGKGINLRVPRVLADPGRAALAWIEVVAGEVPAGTPILALAGPDRAWIDLVVGEPRATNLLCARMNEKGIPPATQNTSMPSDPGAANRRLDMLLREQGDAPAPAARRRVPMAVPVGIIALMLFGWWLFSGGPTPQPADQSAKGPEPTREAVHEPAGPGEGAVRAAIEQAQEAVERLRADAAGEGRAFDESLADRVRQAITRVEKQAATQNPSERAAQRRELAELHAAMEGVQSVAREKADESRQRLTSMLDERARTPAFASEAMRRRWTREVRAIDPAAGWSAARARLDALEPVLANAEKSIQGATRIPMEGVPASVRPGMETLIARGTEEWIGRAGDAAASGASIEPSVSGARTWAAQVETILAQAQRIDTGLNGAFAPDEPVNDTVSMIAALREIQALNDPAAGEALRPLVQQLNDYVAIGELSNTGELAAIVRSGVNGGDPDKSRAIQAWLRLTSLAWPRDGADVREMIALHDLATNAANSFSPKRRPMLASRVNRATLHCATSFLNRCRTGREQTPMFEAMGRLGIEPSDEQSLPGWTRFNLERWRLGEAQQKCEGLDPVARVEALTNAANAFVEKIAEIEGAQTAGRGVRDALDPWASLDFEAVGPGKAGWRVEHVSRDAAEVTYARATGRVPEQRVTFRRLGRGGEANKVSYLATAETSVGVFAAGVAGVARSAGVRGQMPEPGPGEAESIQRLEAALSASFARGGVDPRRGVRSWDWGRRHDEFIVPAYPDSDPPSQGWMRHRPGMEGRSYFPQGATIAPPTWDSPMQYVSATAALTCARLMGCRLPTPDEWTAASGNPGPTNLRDPAWGVLMAHLDTLAGYQPEWPTAGIFVEKDAPRLLPTDDVHLVTEVVDGWAWLATTRVEGARYAHIVGNVAEFVHEDAPGMEAMTDPTPEGAEAFLGNLERLRVIGGSALGGATTPGRPLAVDPAEAMEGFADVGFRLAFSADRSRVSASRALQRIEEAVGAVEMMDRPGDTPARE